MVLKNYDALCYVLEENPKPRGTSRENHIKWFNQYFLYKRDGHKYIITDILNTDVEPMVDKRGGAFNTVEYIKNIELLILDILAQDKNNGEIFISKNKFFYMLEMVNNNYLDCNRRVPKLSKFLDIDENSVQEWYDTTGGMLERNLDSALKKLASQSLIFWSREITICQIVDIENSDYLVKSIHTNKYGDEVEKWTKEKMTRKVIREATDDEKKYILRIERETMLKLECGDKQDIIRKGLWEKFEHIIGDIIKKECNIVYYYQSYKILFNPDHILKKQIQMNELLLDKEKRKEQKSIVNNSIMERIEKNATSRNDNALKNIDFDDISNSKDLRLLRRSSDKYIEDNIELSKTLIDKNSKDIRSQVKKVKLE